MIAYITGKLTVKTPAYVIIETNGIGYHINISLQTYSAIQNLDECKLHTYFHVKEDAQVLFGFYTEKERSIFTNLISISGIGPNTARMILSSITPGELEKAIIEGNVSLIQSIKGVGPKSANRIIIELKDKLAKTADLSQLNSSSPHNNIKDQALSALVMLGFSKSAAEKAIDKSLQNSDVNASVENLIKLSLKNM